MEIGGREIKALASDTRVKVLKSLGSRRKMPSELAREFSMAPSTIVEHLHVLEKSGLIKRVETGHKWTYYELTEKGRSLVRPKFPMQFIVMLSLGVILTFGGIVGFLTDGLQGQAAETVVRAPDYLVGTPGATVPFAVPYLQYGVAAMLVIGILLIIFAAVKLWSKWK